MANKTPSKKELKAELTRASSAAAGVLKDEEEREGVFEKVAKNLGKVKWAEALMDDVRTLVRMVKAYASGDYREIPIGTVLTALGALIYFVSPIDAIPDFIPVFGFTDDAALIALALVAIRSDLDDFREWEGSTGSSKKTAGKAPRRVRASATGASTNKRININTASTAKIADALPISRSVAANIVAHRKKAGKLTSDADLLAVSGIGKSTVDAVSPLIHF